MIKAVIFDLDDTLYPEIEYVKSGLHVVAEHMKDKYSLCSKDIYNNLLELFFESPMFVFNSFLKNNNIKFLKTDIDDIVDVYRKHYPKIQFYSDVVPALIKLRENKIYSGIITDGYKIPQQKKILALDAFSYFDEIIITDELGGKKYWKPNPRAFKIMKNLLKVEFTEMLYIGDNPKKDFYVKNFYPVHTCRIERENAFYKNEIYYGAIHEDFKINNLSMIFDKL